MRWMKRTQRIKKRFLLIPKTIDGETRWFQFAKWEENYSKHWRLWNPVMWLN
jgi:hypothetical protein